MATPTLTVTYYPPSKQVPNGKSVTLMPQPVQGPARADITVTQTGAYTTVDANNATVYNIVMSVSGTSGTLIDTGCTVISAPSTEGFSVRSGDSTKYSNSLSTFVLSWSGATGWPSSCQVQVGVKNQGAGQNTVYVFSKGVSE